MDFIFRATEKFLKDHKKLMRYRKVFAVLAAVVVFATTYELILPAITIDRQRAAETPGMEVGVAAEEVVEESETEGSGADEEDAEAAEEESRTEAEQTLENEDIDNSDASEESADSENVENTDDGNADQANADNGTGAAVDETNEGNAYSKETTESSADAAADTNASATEEAAATATTEAPAVEYPVTLTYEGEDYTVTATFDETAALPAGVSLDALEILPDMVYKDADGNVLYDDYEVYLEKTVDTLEKDGRLEDSYVASARFFDISFIDPEGNYVAPAAPVVIAAQYKKALSADDTVSTTAVRFEAGKDKTEIYETKQDVKNGAIAEISFETKKTSIYGITAAEALETKELTASGDTYEISLSYNQKAEIPEDAKLEAHELLPGTEEYEECAAKSANTDENGETTSRFFDISIMADGAEYEPKAPVNVKITLKDTAPEKVAADKEITHFTNNGQVENIPQEVEESSDGGAEVSFQMDSFSTVEVPLLGAGSTPAYTISVGGTKEITGTTSSSTNSWSSSDETVATVSDSSTNKAIVTGVKAGTATITHAYTYVKGKKQKTVYATESFTIKVEAVSDEITETTEASDGNVTVSIKRTGTTKKLEGYTLVVEKLTSGADFDEYAQALIDNGGDVDALKGMYHIYLKDSDGNEVAVSNANMEVTITDPDLTGLTNVNVGHFKKNNSGAIESKGFTNEESTVFKKFSVADSSITIKIQSFSVFTISAPSTAPGGTSGYSFEYEANSIMGTSAVQSLVGSANQWQIVSGKYENNTVSEKTTSSNGKVRVQKNVIPTDVENEFLMYLSVDINRESVLQEFFEGAGIVYTQANCVQTYGDYYNESSHGTQASQAVDQGGDKGSKHLFRKTKSSGNPYQWTLNITAAGKTYSIVRYGSKSNFNNGHIALNIGNTNSAAEWIEVGPAAKASGSAVFNISISDSVIKKILSNIVAVEIGKVTDSMDVGITATEIVSYKPNNTFSATGNSATISSDGKRITWNMVASTMGYTNDGWYPNIAEMVYKIKYDPSISNGLDNGGTTVSNNPSAQVNTNSSAQITYKVATSGGATTATQDFESPVIRGMLYEIKGVKVDEDNPDKTLSGAAFTLYSDSACTIPVAIKTTGSDGTFDFTNLQWGTYYLKETTTPKGYKTSSTATSTPITVCYTTASKDLTGQGAGEEALYRTVDEMKIPNEPIKITVKKVWEDDDNSAKTRPGSVNVTLKANGDIYNDGGVQTLDGSHGWSYTWSAVPQTDRDGNKITYTVEETSVDGYTTEISYKVGGNETSNIQLENDDAEATVTNKVIQYDVILQKVGQDKQTITGAEVSMGTFDLSSIKTEGKVDLGTDFKLDTEYEISETKAPGGYNLLPSSIKFKVIKDSSALGSYRIVYIDANNASNGMLNLVVSPSTGKNATVLTLQLTNNEGAELPETGGTGFLSPRTLCGIMAMAFVLATAVMYGFSMRRGERRYK